MRRQSPGACRLWRIWPCSRLDTCGHAQRRLQPVLPSIWWCRRKEAILGGFKQQHWHMVFVVGRLISDLGPLRCGQSIAPILVPGGEHHGGINSTSGRHSLTWTRPFEAGIAFNAAGDTSHPLFPITWPSSLGNNVAGSSAAFVSHWCNCLADVCGLIVLNRKSRLL